MTKDMINLAATSLDFIIDPETGDKIHWEWGFPLKELCFDEPMSVELDAPSIGKKYAIYPTQPCECFASDFILNITHNLKRLTPNWMQKGIDPGRLACLGLIQEPKFYYTSGDLYSSELSEIGYGCPDSPTGGIYTWLYPDGDNWTLLVTTIMSALDFPDYDDATAKAMALDCYEKHYKVLYRHSVPRETLEQWREQARAFLTHAYSCMETPIKVP